MKRVQSHASLRSGAAGSDAPVGDDADGMSDCADLPEGKPSRHLWLGNIPLKPNKAAMEVRAEGGLGSCFGLLASCCNHCSDGGDLLHRSPTRR